MESLVRESLENHRLDLQIRNFSPLWKNHTISPPNFDFLRWFPPPEAVPAAGRRERMFEKVVTPSDVGKLNRLVIPKQHAEKFFPLVAYGAAVRGGSGGGGGKGLLLNFEDRNGRSWRFRYSYWNSSQSYVMTKGWSRFVKDKKLDAGDVVSFHRAAGAGPGTDLSKNRLYIDWKHCRRHHPSAAWNPLPAAPLYHPYSSGGGNLVNYKNPEVRMVNEGAPAVGARRIGKKLRLFGVNMECLDAGDGDVAKEDTASFQSLQLRLYNGTTVPSEGKANSNPSVSLDFTL